MKIRTDFVTNSSSSSFIVTFAKISDDKAKQLIKQKGWENYVMTGKKLEEEIRYTDLGADWAGVWIDNPKNIDPNAEYFLFQDCYGDDYDFLGEDDDGWGDYDYDIDLDFFPQDYQDIFMQVDESNGFTEVQQGYGAGRNG